MNAKSTRVLAALAMLPNSGCIQSASCTNSGCISELEVSVTDTSISDGMNAAVSVTVGGETFECVGALTVDETFPDDPALDCENLVVHATADGLRVTVNAVTFDTNAAVSISLDVDDAVVLEQVPLTVDWAFHRPNGPECLPECSIGAASASAAPP